VVGNVENAQRLRGENGTPKIWKRAARLAGVVKVKTLVLGFFVMLVNAQKSMVFLLISTARI